MQLLKATAQGRCIFTFNIKDFSALAIQYSEHKKSHNRHEESETEP